jgi:MYXO-CTERM domain-containing protein
MRRIASIVGMAAFCVALQAPAQAAIGDNSVGMNVHDGRDTFIDACVDLGVQWVRMDANWNSLEPSDDNYQWQHLDPRITDAYNSGLQVYLTLAYTPDWVPDQGDTDGHGGNDVPLGSAEWVDFVTDAVTHFNTLGVTHFGIWNEPNLDGFLEGGHSSLADYVNIILLPGAAAVRAACPTCKVLGPDLANVGDVDVYIEDLTALIPTSTFDIFAHHSYNGFVETGTQEWDGDRYFNVLDQQRFYGTPLASLSRRSLRDLLDTWGFTGEVWMTETGYRASPPGDATEENYQAIYVTRALEEQLLRDWLTNTFFYEIHDCGPDQPSCNIDGFGLMRATSGTVGNRTFPADFQRKPAYYALQQFINDHPEITGTGMAPQCSDGLDNDSDGFVDSADRGCDDALDDLESNDPPRRRIQAPPTTGLTIDGDLAELGTDGWVTLNPNDWRSPEPLGTGDLDVRAAVRWTTSGLYLAIEVTDDIHENSFDDANLWLGDSVQVAFDIAQSGGTGYDTTDDHEFNFALVGGQSRSYRFHGPAAATDAFDVAVVRSGSVTSYEIHLPAATIPSVTFATGQVLGFSFLVNDADGAGRVGWSEFTPGIGMSKVPYYFGEIELVDEVVVGPDAGVGSDAGTTGDGGVSPDGSIITGDGGNPGADSGTTPPADDSGCGCRAAGPTNAPYLALVLGLLLWIRRRA